MTATWLYRTLARGDALQRHGIPAVGVVLEVEKAAMNVVVNNVYILRKVRLRIGRSDGAPTLRGEVPGHLDAR